MTARDALRRERNALCDTFEKLGPDAPTLCDGWTTADLAAHLLVRERDPRDGPGIILGGPFGCYTQKLMDRQKAKGYEALIARLRAGPPGFMTATMPAVKPFGVAVLFLSGRKAAARVTLDGHPDAVEKLRTAKLGV